MTSLFIDTSHHLNLGLLDENYEWIEYFQKYETKNSALLHSKIFEMCSSADILVKDINRIFLNLGPGSYTGIRMAEGIGQIFNIAAIRSFSFYHYDIPLVLNVQKGIWLSKAFKGEYFVFKWDGKNKESSLKKEDTIKKLLSDSLEDDFQIFANCVESIGILDCPIVETSRLTKDFSAKIFSNFEKIGIAREPYYFRSLEEEFSVSFPDY